MMMNEQNQVWIAFETDPPTDEAIKSMNKMLERLGDDRYFIFDAEDNLLITRKSGLQESKKLLDNGDWFNLDFLGRDKEENDNER
tara:strand:- start:717 stop:971 length:255 start_codon:yes stop_codon:yes gene_type:complete